MAIRVGSTTPVYCLSEGAALPAFLSERAKREASKDESYRRRIELLQAIGRGVGYPKFVAFWLRRTNTQSTCLARTKRDISRAHAISSA